MESDYRSLKISREDFCCMVRHCLEAGLDSGYSEHLCDLLADQVAEDVVASADARDWCDYDVGLGIARVLIRALERSRR